jgi:cytoskeletal protein RodZ
MDTFLWILLILVIIIIVVFGYFYYQGATYVPPKVESSAKSTDLSAKSTDSSAKSTDSSDSSKSISELVPKSPESKSLSDKIADKRREFQNASTADKTKMLLKGAVLLSPVGLAAYGGSKLIKKMRNKKK